VFDDAVLFSLFFLPIARSRVRDEAPGGDPEIGLLGKIFEELVPPIALRMALPHAVTHKIQQALLTIGRFSFRPDNRLATRRIVFREGFPAALDIFDLVSLATGRDEALVAEWRAFFQRSIKTRESFEAEAAAEAEASGQTAAPSAPARKRRRGGRGRRRGGA
jgi:hypothetical protein